MSDVTADLPARDTVAKDLGASGRRGVYEVADDQLATGSTLGGPRLVLTIKATGAIDRVYSPDSGRTLLGTVVLRHYDERVGMPLVQETAGRFFIHPGQNARATSPERPCSSTAASCIRPAHSDHRVPWV